MIRLPGFRGMVLQRISRPNKPCCWLVGYCSGKAFLNCIALNGEGLGRCAYLLIMLVVALLSGCAPHIKLTFDAEADINPGPEGEPLSVLLRVYQLDGTEKLNRLAYIDLLDDDISILASELVEHHELIIRPHERKQLRVPMAEEADYVGVVAFFRDRATEHWLQVEALPRRLFGTRRSKRIDMVVTGSYLLFFDREYKHGKLAAD